MHLCICPKHRTTSSHNHTASLLELPQNPGHEFLGQLLEFVRLLLLLLLLVSLSMLLLLVLLVSLLLTRVSSPTLVTSRRRHNSLTTSQVDIDATIVVLGGILQPQLPTHLLDARLNFLNMVRGVVPLADDTISRSGISRSTLRRV